jgi:molybdopterin/thiamine biosynthesis adenylyltransferase
MNITLVLPENVGTAIEEAAQSPLESAGVLLATYLKAPNGEIRLLGRRIVMVEEASYIHRAHDGMSIASSGYVGALGEAETLKAIPMWFHTHPGTEGIPLPSDHDARVDAAIADVFRIRADSSFYGTLIVSPRPDGGLAFSATLRPDNGSPVPIDRIWRVHDGWRLYRAIDSPAKPLASVFDRNVRAFGMAIQQTLADLRITIVGCGGTGSAVAEQLVRLGVRRLQLIDGDVLSESNVTRVYGSTPKDIGRPKVEVLRDHLSAMAPDLLCETHVSMVTFEATARHLIGWDLIFGCTDDNAGRLVLSRVATFLATPVIDVGVLLSSDVNGVLIGIDGRVTVLTPGSACLVCRDRIDLGRAGTELRTPEERQRLEDEGYAPALAGVEPAVVVFTTSVAAAAVNEMLERLIGYGPKPRPSEILLRLHEREISTNAAVPREHHYCNPRRGKLGAGAGAPFLEQTWPDA